MNKCNRCNIQTSKPSEEGDLIDDTSFDIIRRQLHAYKKMLKERNHGSNKNKNENETVVIVDASTMIQRFFFSCFTKQMIIKIM